MKNILLIDDDREVSRSIMELFDSEKFQVTHMTDGATVPEMLARRDDVDVVMLDVNLPTMSGLEVLKKIRKVNNKLPVIIISGKVSTENAIEAMKEGAFEYLAKPFEIDRLIGTVNRACGVVRSSGRPSAVVPPETESGDQDGSDLLIGRSPEIVEIAKLIGHIARTDAPTLVFGEAGTGKEMAARAIHRNSPRRVGPFLTVSCTSLADTLLESETFGHEKGAFTGAYYKRLGKFEQADRGTLFFDEVADLSLVMQAKLLKSVEDGTFERVGGTERLRADARIIAATSKSLVQAIKDGSFRVDLFYRLKVVSIFMPPLRDRKGDVDILTDHFIQKFARQMNKPAMQVSKEARDMMNRYSWPGNVRELENNVHTAMVMARGDDIQVGDLPMNAEMESVTVGDLESLQESQTELFQKVIDPLLPSLAANSEGKIYNFLHSAMERALISSALKLYGSNQVKTSEALGISRNTLRDRISRYNLY